MVVTHYWRWLNHHNHKHPVNVTTIIENTIRTKSLWFRFLNVLYTLIPAPTRKSTRTDFILVWPLLKSSPPIKLFLLIAKSTSPVVIKNQKIKIKNWTSTLLNNQQYLAFETNSGILRLKTWNKSVLWASIYERNIFINASQSIQGWWGYLWFILLHSSQEVLHGVIQPHNNITVPLCVGSPQHNHLVHLVFLLELPS